MSRPVRVLLATRIFPPEAGAAAYRLGALVSALTTAGHRAVVLTTRPPAGSSAARPRDGVLVRRWPVLRDRGGNVRGYLQYASFDLPLALRLLVHTRPDVVVVEPPPTTGLVVRAVCALRRVPYVYYAADLVSVAARGIGVSGPVVRALTAVEGYVLRGAAQVLTVSDEVAGGVLAMGVDPDRVNVVGTGVDTEVFTPDGPRLETDGPTAVYAGTMSEIQGASVFVEAMREVVARLPDARLLMLGQGSEVPELRRLAARLPAGAVELPGVMGGARTARWLRSARVGLASVRPGRGYDVAFATKTFASTASGSPVVYAGVGPCRDIVADNELGRSVPWEPSAVAAAMVELLEREPVPAERARLVEWTREHYSLATVAARAAHAVADVARRGGEPRA